MEDKVTSAVQEAIEQGRGYKDSMDEIVALIKGRVPLIWVVTHEETRFIAEFKERVGKEHDRHLWVWSGYEGLKELQKKMTIEKASGDQKDTDKPAKALDCIAAMSKLKPDEGGGYCFLMRDMHADLDSRLVRQIRDMYGLLIGHAKTLVVVSPVLAHGPGGRQSGLPPTLEKQICVVHYELPDQGRIKQRIVQICNHMKEAMAAKNDKDTILDYSDEELDGFAKALRGLTMVEVDNALATSITHLNRLHVEKLINEKKQIIRKSDTLEFVDVPVKEGDVGGLDMAKEYLKKYASAYDEDAKEFGMEPLKGVLLTGIPGTGKSLLAKVLGKMWKMPLLRLDIGRVMTGLVGGSEARMREVVNQAKAMAPCLLWIDEIEKSLSGTKSSNFSDAGTMSRVFGTLLYAMEEELKGVTLVATANDITLLPPELIRRFDEVFFVDLPGPDERWDIFKIHLSKRGRDPAKFEKYRDTLVEASDDYTGAEIEKAVKHAIASAFHNKRKDVGYQDIVKALQDTKPISEVMAKKVKRLREEARGRYVFASSWAENQSEKRDVKTKSGKRLNIDEALGDLKEIKKPVQKGKKDVVDEDDRFKNIN